MSSNPCSRVFGLALLVAMTGMTACKPTDSASSAATALEPPIASQVAHLDETHGVPREDPYFWLREKENPDVISYLEAENAYSEGVMASTADLQETLYEEMVGRLKETDLDVPFRDGDYFYYSRTEEGKNYPIKCRKKGSLGGEEEVLLDLNAEAEGKDYYSLGGFAVSPNQQLLAWAEDTVGDERLSIRFKNLETDELLPDVIPGASYGLEWGNDNRTIFYVTRDEAQRPYRLYRHVLGATGEDELIFEEEDDRFFLDIAKTRSEQFLLMPLGSSVTSEVWFLDANEPAGEFQVFKPRVQDIEYGIDHRDGHFYIMTNEEARNFRLLKTPVSAIEPANWEEVIAHREDVRLQGLDLFRDMMVLSYRRGGLRRLDVKRFDTGEQFEIEMPEEVFTLFAENNAEFDTNVYRFQYTSLVSPRSIFDFDTKSRAMTLLKEDEVLGGYDRSLYATQRVEATAPDGTAVPISLVYRKDLLDKGKNPALLYGYGSYGSSSEPFFRSSRLSYLDRGWVFAIGHVRGGGEMGEYWHDDGKMLSKKNTFSDFVACGEYLIAEGWAAPDQLAIYGGSAGGLLIGAVLNLRPDLFAAAHAAVPFVDVINTMLDDSIPLTVTEYEEWGNPNDKEYFDYMLSYSPYDNLKETAYPHLLVTAGLNDPRVQYWEPAKWVAKLRETREGDEMLLLKTNMGAGHRGASGRYDRYRELAFETAFLMSAVEAGR